MAKAGKPLFYFDDKRSRIVLKLTDRSDEGKAEEENFDP